MAHSKNQEMIDRCMAHNFWTWSAQKEIQPIPVQRAEGVFFWDFEGKRYLDFNSMVMCSNIGHGNAQVIDAICKQARELAFAGPHMATEVRAKLLEKLCEVVPEGLNKFLFTLGGADANENAIKIARAVTGKHKILARYRSYHGASHGAVALSGDLRRVSWEPNIMGGVVHFPVTYRYRDDLVPDAMQLSDEVYAARHLDYLEKLIHYEGTDSIAAIFLEAVTGTNGILVPPDGYLQGIRALCDRYGILMIVDEVMTGFGRTGAWFAVDHWKVKPDLMTMAKGLTSAYAPLGVVGMREDIAAYFDHRKFDSGLTYNGHPISFAAAIANIDVLQAQDLINHTRAMQPDMLGLLNELKKKHPSVGDVRGIGLFGAIELIKDKKSGIPLGDYGKTPTILKELQEFTLAKGLFHYIHDNLILVIPPLIISQDELEMGISILDEALKITDAAL
ncbi:MAG: aminotransferase class III-fold pyridoxal phosphate-dependent enzyme [Anaerolineaceae bacterium]|jgi:taurine--2-oxoglutarate transaminase|nr:MAG: aminotransferase class III-fold pyridoxal phosphate-dependent enzyme [Anaerolineaceae bacterium]